ncbi:hypothetical protein K1719_006026 [Acacia pycnantha]|nr:hypothetical protein K1719_006026 [Acacia pycnantha]
MGFDTVDSYHYRIHTGIEAFENETKSALKNRGLRSEFRESIGQLSKQIAERSQGSFPSDTEVNPKEHCKAITTRSGIVVQPVEKFVPMKDKSEKGEEEVEQCNVQEVPKEIVTKKSPTPSYAKPPYPQRLKQQIQKQQYAKFLDIF